MHELLDLTGEKYGRLTVIESMPKRYGKRMWLCECECGKQKIISQSNLRCGISKSCGCYKKEATIQSHTTHGKRNTRLYHIYKGMKARCYNQNEPKYRIYGARGITICDEWLNKTTGFETFYDWAMNNGYSDNLSIDRIDVNGNYEPSNCRWATAKEQALNTRYNVVYSAFGEEKTAGEWAEQMGINRSTFCRRIKRGYTVEDMLMSKSKRMYAK